jgi:hypothetical protein
MPDLDVAEAKAALTRLHESEAGNRSLVAPPSGDDHELEQELRALDSDREFRDFGRSLERYRILRRKAIGRRQAAERGYAEQFSAAAGASVAGSFAAQAMALTPLAEPHTSTLVTLDKPFAIWQMPHPDMTFKDSHIEAHNSWFKVNIFSSSGPYESTYIAYYIWDNPSDAYALVNVSSGMSLNGTAIASGSSGRLSGNFARLQVDLTLTAIRWHGWTDPLTGQDVDLTPYPIVASRTPVNFQAYGGDWFTDATPESTTLNPFHWYRLEIPLMAIPGRATAMFEVATHVWYDFFDIPFTPWDLGPHEDNELDDLVALDLADERKGYMARPGMIVLEILSKRSGSET